ncbi:MAG: ATP-dependent Clp protease proteolytic subunit [Terriglobales bacterium]
METPPTQIPADVYGIFSGPIDQDGTQRLINNLTTASANNVKSVHIVFQCLGGGIGEGICLHNVFQTLPFELTLYNSGSVASIAVIAFLGAKRRKVSAYASFMIHRTQTTTQAANTQTVKAFAKSAVLFDENTEAILRKTSTCQGRSGTTSITMIFGFLRKMLSNLASRMRLRNFLHQREPASIRFESTRPVTAPPFCTCSQGIITHYLDTSPFIRSY